MIVREGALLDVAAVGINSKQTTVLCALLRVPRTIVFEALQQLRHEGVC